MKARNNHPVEGQKSPIGKAPRTRNTMMTSGGLADGLRDADRREVG